LALISWLSRFLMWPTSASSGTGSLTDNVQQRSVPSPPGGRSKRTRASGVSRTTMTRRRGRACALPRPSASSHRRVVTAMGARGRGPGWSASRTLREAAPAGSASCCRYRPQQNRSPERRRGADNMERGRTTSLALRIGASAGITIVGGRGAGPAVPVVHAWTGHWYFRCS
jgi:hypothetical protein